MALGSRPERLVTWLPPGTLGVYHQGFHGSASGVGAFTRAKTVERGVSSLLHLEDGRAIRYNPLYRPYASQGGPPSRAIRQRAPRRLRREEG